MDGDQPPMPNFLSPSLDKCSGSQWKFPPSYEWLDATSESDLGRLTRKGKFRRNFARRFPNWKSHSNDRKKSRGSRGFVTQRSQRYFIERTIWKTILPGSWSKQKRKRTIWLTLLQWSLTSYNRIILPRLLFAIFTSHLKIRFAWLLENSSSTLLTPPGDLVSIIDRMKYSGESPQVVPFN